METPETVVDAETGRAVSVLAVGGGLAATVAAYRAEAALNGSSVADEKEARRDELLSLQRKQQEHVQAVLSEEIEAEKEREVRYRMESKSTRKLMRTKFDRERAKARERIGRIKEENELVLAARMAQLNFLR